MKIKKIWFVCGYALTATYALSLTPQAAPERTFNPQSTIDTNWSTLLPSKRLFGVNSGGSGASSSASDDGTINFSPSSLRQAGLR